MFHVLKLDSDLIVNYNSNSGKKEGKKSSLISNAKNEEKEQRHGLANCRMTNKTRRMLKMIISLILSYCVCWLPYHLWTISGTYFGLECSSGYTRFRRKLISRKNDFAKKRFRGKFSPFVSTKSESRKNRDSMFFRRIG